MLSKPRSKLTRAIAAALLTSACGLCAQVSADELQTAGDDGSPEVSDVGEMSRENLFKLDSIMLT